MPFNLVKTVDEYIKNCSFYDFSTIFFFCPKQALFLFKRAEYSEFLTFSKKKKKLLKYIKIHNKIFSHHEKCEI